MFHGLTCLIHNLGLQIFAGERSFTHALVWHEIMPQHLIKNLSPFQLITTRWHWYLNIVFKRISEINFQSQKCVLPKIQSQHWFSKFCNIKPIAYHSNAVRINICQNLGLLDGNSHPLPPVQLCRWAAWSGEKIICAVDKELEWKVVSRFRMTLKLLNGSR